MIFKFLTIFFCFFIFFNASVDKKIIKGKAKIIDGDTIHIINNKIRLHGIDAPEINQKCQIDEQEWFCGIESKNALIKLILEDTVKCKILDIDRYNRFIGICFVREKNINSYMVQNGWAIAYRYYSLDYINEEKIAKENKMGIWKGLFEEPYIFRKKQKKN